MCAIWKCGIGLGPKLDKASDPALHNREERNSSCGLHTVRDRDVRDGFGLATNDAIDCELPSPMRWILLIHARKSFRAANYFLGLWPFQHEFRRQHRRHRMKVVRCHQAPELANNPS